LFRPLRDRRRRIGPTQVGVIQRLVRRARTAASNFAGLGGLVSVEEDAGLRRKQHRHPEDPIGRRRRASGFGRSLAQLRIGENPGRLVDGCAQSIEPGLIGRTELEPCHGSRRELRWLWPHQAATTSQSGHRGTRPTLRRGSATYGQIGAQELLSQNLAGPNRGPRTGNPPPLRPRLASGDCAQTDVQGAGVLPSAAEKNPLCRSARALWSAN